MQQMDFQRDAYAVYVHCSTSQQSKSVLMRRNNKHGVMLKRPDSRNQVGHTGRTFTLKTSVEKTEAR